MSIFFEKSRDTRMHHLKWLLCVATKATELTRKLMLRSFTRFCSRNLLAWLWTPLSKRVYFLTGPLSTPTTSLHTVPSCLCRRDFHFFAFCWLPTIVHLGLHLWRLSLCRHCFGIFCARKMRNVIPLGTFALVSLQASWVNRFHSEWLLSFKK